MLAQDILTACDSLSLMDLYKVQSDIEQKIEKQKCDLINSVKSERDGQKVFLKHPTNGTYLCKQAAYAGRWRMWKMVEGQRGLKQRSSCRGRTFR
jgi:phage gp16-like protein